MATQYERLSPQLQEHFSGASQIQARHAVLSCFYGPDVELTSIFEMLVMPRDQILAALHELLDSDEITQVKDADSCVPVFRRTTTWEAQ